MVEEKYQRLLAIRDRRDLGNSNCADCRASDPEWTSLALGIFICAACAESHKRLGQQYARVRSIQSVEWSNDSITRMQECGNSQSNLKYEPHVPIAWRRIQALDPVHVRDDFIEAKYVLRSFTHPLEQESCLNVLCEENKKWKLRSVELKDGQLSFFKQQDTERAMETIWLKDAHVFIVDAKAHRAYTLQLLTVDRITLSMRSHFISGESGADIMRWLNACRLSKSYQLVLERFKESPALPIAIERLLGCEIVGEGWTYRYVTSNSKWHVAQQAAYRLQNATPSKTPFFDRLLGRSSKGEFQKYAPTEAGAWYRFWTILTYSEILLYPEPMSFEPIEQILLPPRSVRTERLLQERLEKRDIAMVPQAKFCLAVEVDLKVKLQRQVSAFEIIKGSRIVEVVDESASSLSPKEYLFAVESETDLRRWIEFYDAIRYSC